VNLKSTIILFVTLLLFAGCRTPVELLETGELVSADISAEEFKDLIPDYSGTLETLSGTGRAFISQPGNNDRITLDFHSDKEASLVTFRNRIGIEGGQVLVRDDSVLVYNRIDKIAEKVSLRDANLTEVGSLATINLIDLFHYPAVREEISEVFQDDQYYVAATETGTRITIDKENGFIMDLQTAPDSDRPYSRINYETYERQDGFYLPRKITIFSSNGDTRVVLLVRQLQTNRQLPALEIDIPDDDPILIL
jgi:hypothetical protein